MVEARPYRSIPELLRGTGFSVVSVSDIKGLPGKGKIKTWCEEHYQVLFTMVELDRKTPQQAAQVLPFSLDMLVDIINLDPVYKIMRILEWRPQDRCETVTVIPNTVKEPPALEISGIYKNYSHPIRNRKV